MKKSFQTTILSLFLLFFTFSGFSCSKTETLRAEHERYITYTNVVYGEHERHLFDLSIPKNKQSAGLILFIHGGGWMAGDKSGYESFPAYWCGEQGFATIALNYRYASLEDGVNVTDILDDITLCLIKAKALFLEHSLRVEKMLLTGGSAGAHLSLLYAYSKADVAPIQPAAVCSFAGPTDFLDGNYYKESPLKDDLVKMISNASGYAFTDTDAQTLERARPFLMQSSPLFYVTENAVPTILCHGEEDDVVPITNARSLAQKLKEYGVLHELIVYPRSGHGLENDPEQSAKAEALMLEYAKTYLS